MPLKELRSFKSCRSPSLLPSPGNSRGTFSSAWSPRGEGRRRTDLPGPVARGWARKPIPRPPRPLGTWGSVWRSLKPRSLTEDRCLQLPQHGWRWTRIPSPPRSGARRIKSAQSKTLFRTKRQRKRRKGCNKVSLLLIHGCKPQQQPHHRHTQPS